MNKIGFLNLDHPMNAVLPVRIPLVNAIFFIHLQEVPEVSHSGLWDPPLCHR